ncbi:hypothetical protein GCM10007301_15720 [Azorhizobium oxalatiphilum]|uniref:Uncharacterized protein n=1 Tax=Azorhizobium oxalatiphilum TaxID=980631 RepID=A0A917F6Z5_9HYPH|nr:hypothetical protein [Azorhizobium oxalatiphilum]GGF56873.1 hypothetical protein GCM10007301_15720 [Azorhizobium oxalatiphilum]
MPSDPLRVDEPLFSASETDVDEVLAAHDGDARAAVRGCLDHIAKLEMQVSRGFIRLPFTTMAALNGDEG